MRIVFVCEDPCRSASARVRVADLHDAFVRRGVELRSIIWDASGKASMTRLGASVLAAGRWADAVVIQKPRFDPKIIRALQAVNSNIFIDIDDAIWETGHGAKSAARPAAERERRFVAAARSSRLVVAGSHHLATEAQRRSGARRVAVVRSGIDEKRYVLDAGEVRNQQPMTVGWIGSEGNFADFGPAVVHALRRLTDEGWVRLITISSSPIALRGVPETFLAWSEKGAVTSLRQIDVGLMPLRDDERSRGRCSYKAIQHLALGRPVIASPVGGAPEVVQDGRTGLLASSAEEWYAAIARLRDDVGLRHRLGDQGRELVLAEASVEVCVDRWIELIDQYAR